LCSTDGASRDDERRIRADERWATVLLGAVSDVHCNAVALTQALAEMDQLGVTTVLAGGDLVFEYRFSSEVVRLVREREMPAVQGNHEVVLLGPHGVRAREAEHVDPVELAFLQGLPFVVRAEYGGRRVHLTHASPWEPHFEYLYPDSRRWDDAPTLDTDVVVVGHTHVPFVRRVGSTLVVNPGSIGQLRGAQARFTYAVIDTLSMDAEIRAVPG
jgi:putative phosphoesterase